uniref:Exported protein n=1 Tax=Strongyloides papillosus TaxID=174720 RepID=A0A0N5C2P6_STREA
MNFLKYLIILGLFTIQYSVQSSASSEENSSSVSDTNENHENNSELLTEAEDESDNNALTDLSNDTMSQEIEKTDSKKKSGVKRFFSDVGKKAKKIIKSDTTKKVGKGLVKGGMKLVEALMNSSVCNIVYL